MFVIQTSLFSFFFFSASFSSCSTLSSSSCTYVSSSPFSFFLFLIYFISLYFLFISILSTSSFSASRTLPYSFLSFCLILLIAFPFLPPYFIFLISFLFYAFPSSSLLHYSSFGFKYLIVILTFLEVDVFATGMNGYTALHDATQNNHIEVVKLLIKAGGTNLFLSLNCFLFRKQEIQIFCVKSLPLFCL